MAESPTTVPSLARRLYPEADRDGYFSAGGYDAIIAHIVPDPWVREDIGSYQGDTCVFGTDGAGKYVYLNFGWGSCSGCDALQGCSSYADLDALVERLVSGALYWDSLAEAHHWWCMHDWDGDYSADDRAGFVRRVRDAMESRLPR